MFEKALVAVDLSPAEQPILECLPALRNWGMREVVLTHVMRVGYMQGAGMIYKQDYVDWLERCAQPLRAAGLLVEARPRSSGVPADDILALAAETAADFIVVGSRGHNMLSKLFLGSVARSVIRKTALPVLLEWIEPTAQATQVRCEAVCVDTLRHILLATDFSEHAAAAEKAFFELARHAQSVECVHVRASDGKHPGLTEQAAQEHMDRLLQRLDALGVQAKARLLKGKPSDEIARHAQEQDVSMIVVGKHGQNWLASTVIGSTAANLCEIAGRPVLMVP